MLLGYAFRIDAGTTHGAMHGSVSGRWRQRAPGAHRGRSSHRPAVRSLKQLSRPATPCGSPGGSNCAAALRADRVGRLPLAVTQGVAFGLRVLRACGRVAPRSTARARGHVPIDELACDVACVRASVLDGVKRAGNVLCREDQGVSRGGHRELRFKTLPAVQGGDPCLRRRDDDPVLAMRIDAYGHAATLADLPDKVGALTHTAWECGSAPLPSGT